MAEEAWETRTFSGSTQIVEAAYHVEKQTLRITFLKGLRYEYYRVPAEAWEAFQNAESAGKFFHKVIEPGYDYRLLE